MVTYSFKSWDFPLIYNRRCEMGEVGGGGYWGMMLLPDYRLFWLPHMILADKSHLCRPAGRRILMLYHWETLLLFLLELADIFHSEMPISSLWMETLLFMWNYYEPPYCLLIMSLKLYLREETVRLWYEPVMTLAFSISFYDWSIRFKAAKEFAKSLRCKPLVMC